MIKDKICCEDGPRPNHSSRLRLRLRTENLAPKAHPVLPHAYAGVDFGGFSPETIPG